MLVAAAESRGIGLRQSYPRLGIDARNQFDYYRDLPGGLNELHRQADFVHKKGKKCGVIHFVDLLLQFLQILHR